MLLRRPITEKDHPVLGEWVLVRIAENQWGIFECVEVNAAEGWMDFSLIPFDEKGRLRLQ